MLRSLESLQANLQGWSLIQSIYQSLRIHKAGAGYGNEITFTTSPIALATLTTSDVISITSNSAISGGNITDDGGES